MDAKKIGILGGIAAGAYFLSKKVVDVKQKIEEDIEIAKDKLDSLTYEAETVLEDLNNTQIPPAEKYIKITPVIEFTDVTGKLWIGRFRWYVKNTSNDFTFVIDRIRSNYEVDGYLGSWVPGHRRLAYSLGPGEEHHFNATWQDKAWFENPDARDAIRDELQAHMDEWLNILTCKGVEVTVLQVGQYANFTAKFENVQGMVQLRSGAIKYFDNEGEDAYKWGNPEYESSLENQLLDNQASWLKG